MLHSEARKKMRLDASPYSLLVKLTSGIETGRLSTDRRCKLLKLKY